MTPQIVLALIWAMIALVGSLIAIALLVGAVRDLKAVRKYRLEQRELVILARGHVWKYAAAGGALGMFVLVGIASIILPPGVLRMYLGRSLILAELLLVLMLEIDWRIQRLLVKPAIHQAKAADEGGI